MKAMVTAHDMGSRTTEAIFDMSSMPRVTKPTIVERRAPSIPSSPSKNAAFSSLYGENVGMNERTIEFHCRTPGAEIFVTTKNDAMLVSKIKYTVFFFSCTLDIRMEKEGEGEGRRRRRREEK